MIGVTSGSTGRPKTYPKSWRAVCGSTAQNIHVIRERLRLAGDATAWIVATVPPQHMYGMEFSIMLPLVGGLAVHSGRPLFPADIAHALEELPTPRIGQHSCALRALVESAQSFPKADLIISATAPLDRPLAAAVERKLSGELLEIFGSTETCVIARRRTAHEDAWNLHEGVRLEPRSDGTLVDAPWYRGADRVAGPRRAAGRGHFRRAWPQQRHDRSGWQARIAHGSDASTDGHRRRARCRGISTR